ncbi:MAG TPA: toxin-antitoxin system HicB family antitoxin [Actinomycetes bacterium]|nr:toxin-antitoxin system HicB family antitoxin [Actinomycetes bacterium]
MGKSVQIRELPDEVHRQLRIRAASAGQSLNTYLVHLLVAHASQPTLAEIMKRVELLTDGASRKEIDAAVRQARQERERQTEGPGVA